MHGDDCDDGSLVGVKLKMNLMKLQVSMMRLIMAATVMLFVAVVVMMVKTTMKELVVVMILLLVLLVACVLVKKVMMCGRRFPRAGYGWESGSGSVPRCQSHCLI